MVKKEKVAVLHVTGVYFPLIFSITKIKSGELRVYQHGVINSKTGLVRCDIGTFLGIYKSQLKGKIDNRIPNKVMKQLELQLGAEAI